MRAVFIDRDGVINRDRVDFVLDWAEFEWLPGVIEAVARLKAAGWRVVVFTNQSCIGRGLIEREAVERINRRMAEIMAENGAELDGVYVCPHAPGEECDCRKPLPGLILKAAAELDLDLSRSVVIGDAARDIQAGRAAGVAENILVRTGKGAAAERDPALRPDHVFDDLAQAVEFLLKE